MKKLILLLLIVGCEETVFENSDTEIKNYKNLSWAAQVEFGGYDDSTYHHDTTIQWYSYDSHNYFWDTTIFMIIDTIVYIPTYIADCYYIDTLNQCSNLKPHLLYNGFEEDTTSFNHWAEIRLPNNQIDYDILILYANTNDGEVNLYIINKNYAIIKTIVNEHQNPGYHSIMWNGEDDVGAIPDNDFYRVILQLGDSVCFANLHITNPL